MKKIMSMVVALVLIFSMRQTVKAEETQSRYFSISDFNEEYANGGFLSLEEFNNKYSYGESPLKDEVEVSMLRDNLLMTTSAQQVKTEPIILYYRGIRVGRITLKYKTWIQGGRPQFLYDSCYLSNPVLEDGWTLMDANVTFSGDKITVYIACFSGSDHDKSWVYFDPY